MAKVFNGAGSRPTRVWTVDPLLSCSAAGQDCILAGIDNPALYDSESGLCSKKISNKQETWTEGEAYTRKQCNTRLILIMASIFILLSVLVVMVTTVAYLAVGEAQSSWQKDEELVVEEGISLVEGHIKITNRVFTQDLYDLTSDAFRKLSVQIRQSMDAVFIQSLQYYNETEILSFTKGSVIARCRIHLSRPRHDATHQIGMAVIQALERHHGFLPGRLLQVDIRSLHFTELPDNAGTETREILQLPVEKWSVWSEWSTCFEVCGVQTRYRKCLTSNCTESDKEVRNCTCDLTVKVNEETASNETGECSENCNDGQICIILSPSSFSRCLVARDIEDPTGCGGWCVGDHQLCKRIGNGTFQCADNAANCKDSYWKCGNNLCIPENRRCDGHMDCFDMSDEFNCECKEEEFQCGNNTSCLQMSVRCNGKVDCWDGSDEINCTVQCVDDKYTCNDGRCIDKQQFCDGYPDCEDVSDEPDGCSAPCLRTQNQCQNGRCINSLLWCNGVDNCGDGTDERACDQPELLKSHR